jgi:hypothetical protein
VCRAKTGEREKRSLWDGIVGNGGWEKWSAVNSVWIAERRIAPLHHFTGAEFGVGAGAPRTKHCRSAPSPGAFRGVPAGASQELVWPISGRPNNAWGG